MKKLPYHIKAYDPTIDMVIQFWLYAKSREHLDKILKEKDITNIEWIRQEVPDWEK